jgi:hypothetical protein
LARILEAINTNCSQLVHFPQTSPGLERLLDAFLAMSFLFGRARTRTAVDLPKQAREQLLKLDSPSPPKVRMLHPSASELGWLTLW